MFARLLSVVDGIREVSFVSNEARLEIKPARFKFKLL